MLSDVIYIDTNPGRGTMFSPPEGIEDYRFWLLDKYDKSRVMQSNSTHYYFGVGQKINEILNRPGLVAQKKIEGNHLVELQVMAHGPYAGKFAGVINELSQGIVQVEVLG